MDAARLADVDQRVCVENQQIGRMSRFDRADSGGEAESSGRLVRGTAVRKLVIGRSFRADTGPDGVSGATSSKLRCNLNDFSGRTILLIETSQLQIWNERIFETSQL